ncbi:MAG: DUF4292 domain-containing protein [Bacteroidota bacterium]|nr:DUF4292 domain-containing protein [Bacteroidota bacterium]MDP4211314.1 DUF4292 domain-containing protein [Bacteroidota bacterium]MDP4249997.1 DUF4292 domain-containing protein [Bacteroidota bacterium]
MIKRIQKKSLGFLGMIAAVILIGISVGGCRSAKKITTAIAKKDTTMANPVDSSAMEDLKADSIRYIRTLYDHIKSNTLDCNTFSAKIKVHYEGSDGKDYEFTAFLRLQRDQMIWVSINAVLGIEAFRAVITPDSVMVLSKLDKVYQLRSVSYLQEITHLPFDFQTLQALILGNPVYLDSNIVFYRKDDQGISLLSEGKLFRNYITLNKDDLSIKHSKLDDVDRLRARSCDLTYGDYEKKDVVLFSTYRKIAVAEKARLDIELTFKQYSFNEPLNFPFSIPKNYKQK